MKKKRMKLSIKLKLLLIALLPLLILDVIIVSLSVKNIRSGMQSEALTGLRGIAFSAQQIFDTADSGKYSMDSKGTVTKGDYTVSENYDIVDKLKKSSHYDVTIFYNDTRVTTSLTNQETGKRLVGTKASEKVIQTVLKEGKEYSDTNVIINNTPYYGYYVPITQNDTVIGMSFAGMPSTEANAFIQKKVILIVVVSLIILIVLITTCLLFAKKLGNALTGIEHALQKIKNGSLNITLDKAAKKRKDEIGSMAQRLEELSEELTKIIGNVKQSSNVLHDSSVSLEKMAHHTSETTREIGSAIEEVSKGAMTQAEETEMASSNILEMGQIITDIVSSVNVLDEASRNMKEASDESDIIIKELSRSNDETTEAIHKIGQQVHTTNDSVQEIGKAVEVITSIAEETNLLSLNASIEAARAGEHGKGFAVVASEIQKLAEESSKSASEIRDIIEQLLTDSEQTVQVMEEVDVIVNEQRKKLTQTKEKFHLVVEGVNSTRKEAEIIEEYATACDEARTKIMDVIQNLAAISQENAASSEQTNASMEEFNVILTALTKSASDLLELSKALENDMAFFQL